MKKEFTENINYSKTGKPSIWGSGDPKTIKVLEKTNTLGKWLNLAAGDGRYNNLLLEKVDFLIASDIDNSALRKLKSNSPKKYRNKLLIKVFDLTKKFPLQSKSFNGVFCAGTLHLFPEKTLRKVFNEIFRVLKPGSKFIFDFAVDVKRIKNDGKFYIRGNEPLYSLENAKKLLKAFLAEKYDFKLYQDTIKNEKIHTPQGFNYLFSCKFIIIVAQK